VTPSVRLAGVVKRFGGREALAGVDLELGPEELVVVLGPAGAGKTTLLRVIAGLETPDAGAVELVGRDARDLPPAERDVAMVFQDFALYPDWTVRRNLEFPLLAPGRVADPAERAARIAWAADLLRIAPLLDRPAARLSGGEMQRVAIGRAIVRRPRLFLLDEPLANLDAKLREALRVELVEVRRAAGAPMLYVTHDQAEALSMADRIVVLGEGRVLQTGTPEDVYRRPATPEVARRLGMPPINLWREEGMTVGVRPEDLRPDGGSDEAVVTVVEPQGPVRIAVATWRGRTVRLSVPRDRAIRPGERIQPSFDSAAALRWPG
jgi:multiple sugar transport system ATP-binding protein